MTDPLKTIEQAMITYARDSKGQPVRIDRIIAMVRSVMRGADEVDLHRINLNRRINKSTKEKRLARGWSRAACKRMRSGYRMWTDG